MQVHLKIGQIDALFLAKTRAAYQKIINLGFTDAFRCINPQPMNYTFWDFQAGAWNKNEGYTNRPFFAQSTLCRFVKRV